MYVITNRTVDANQSGLDVFGRDPNPEGPNELRLVEVSDSGNFDSRVLKDELSKAEKVKLKEDFDLDINPDNPWFASLKVACELYGKAHAEQKHLLFFVHGYNNDMADILATARELQNLYNLIVVPFSWPANGGGKLSGTAAYLSDKDDARSSATALHRAVGKVHEYHEMLTQGLQRRLWRKAIEKHPQNRQQAHALFSRLVEKECQFTLNLMCHSMGNYVLKYAVNPGDSALRRLVFDNIALVAADANNPGHERWVEQLRTRNRLFVLINENDHALKWSRRKPGDEQLERLGAHLRGLVAGNAYYLNLSGNRGVGSEHSYFKGASVAENATLKRIFARVLEGGNGESGLQFRADLNYYHS